MKEERFPHTRKPLRGRRLRVAEGETLAPRRRAQPQGCGGQWRDSRTKDRRRAALTSPRGLSAHPLGRAALGAEARASVGSQGEDWGWWREHSLKGLARHGWPGGSPGKGLELPKRQETTVSGSARRGDSEHHLNELQRRVRAAAISTDPRDGHEVLPCPGYCLKKLF